MTTNPIPQNWWRDPRCHFGDLTINSPLLHQRDDIQPAMQFICTELALPASARILDLCCGAGRYAVELAHRGYDVVGLDINETYIALARQLAVREGVQATFLTGDMRQIPYESQFDAIINVGTSFGFFDSEVEDHRVLKAVAGALKPGGIFLLEMANRDYYLGHFTARDWHKRKDGSLILVQREFDYVSSRINTFFERSGPGEPESWSHSWRAYTLAELVLMLGQAGLRFSRVLGDWGRRTYSVDSPRMLLLSTKE